MQQKTFSEVQMMTILRQAEKEERAVPGDVGKMGL